MANGTTTEQDTTEQVGSDRTVVDILKPETCPPALRKFYNDIQRENIADAVKQGYIVTENKNVKISKKRSGTGRAELWPFILYRAVTQQGMSALARGKVVASKPMPDAEKLKAMSDKEINLAKAAHEDGACDYFNYGYGLIITQPIRTLLDSKIGGADKEVEKQIKTVMKTGLFLSEDAARDFVIAQRKSLNLEVPDAFAGDEDEEDNDTENQPNA